MTDDLEALLAAATEGPWSFDGDWWRLPTIFAADGKTKVAIVEKADRNKPTDAQQANAALIVALRNAAPSLLAQLRAAEERVAVLEEALRPFAEAVSGEGLSEHISMAQPTNADWRRARLALSKDPSHE